MSEELGSAVAEASGPTSTADIAASVIHEAESTSESRIDTTNTVEERPEPVALSPEDQEIQSLLEQYGFKDAKKPDGREYWIPRSKVLKMIGSGLKRGTEKWATERGTIEQQVKDAHTQLAELRTAVSGDPRAFLSQLAEHDARYRAFLEPAAPAPVVKEPPAAEMPGPDVDLGNGQRTYSLEGLQKRDAWVQAQLLKELEGKLDARLKPLTEREERTQAETRQRQVYQQTMQEAQAWPMFGSLAADGSLSEFQTEVLNELKKDSEQAKAKGVRPQMTLRQAYLEVYSRQQSPEKIRERVLAELKTAPASPSLTRTGTEPSKPSGPRSTQDIARDTIRKLESA